MNLEQLGSLLQSKGSHGSFTESGKAGIVSVSAVPKNSVQSKVWRWFEGILKTSPKDGIVFLRGLESLQSNNGDGLEQIGR